MKGAQEEAGPGGDRKHDGGGRHRQGRRGGPGGVQADHARRPQGREAAGSESGGEP